MHKNEVVNEGKLEKDVMMYFLTAFFLSLLIACKF